MVVKCMLLSTMSPRPPSAPPPAVELAQLDVGYLAMFVGQAFADAVLQALAAAGHPELRFSHGFVIQHVIDADRTIGELAERMRVTQQGASKAVAELETLGYLERVPDVSDARIRRVRLSALGREAVQVTRQAREKVARKLSSQIGEPALAGCRQTLARMLEALGGAEAVRARKVLPPR
jgi:DNA-binding MarR family transcriptional regulator